MLEVQTHNQLQLEKGTNDFLEKRGGGVNYEPPFVFLWFLQKERKNKPN